MGNSSYSSTTRSVRAETMGYFTKSPNEIFTKRTLDIAMNPKDVKIREARDSEEHPNSLPIVLALDVTGSMGRIPADLVKDGLPNIMDGIIQCGIPDPQVLFLGIGDHECDDAPLQAGQFESGDEELDKWLTSLYIESGGGGNDGESYLLAWYFAGYHTITDHFEKRGKKGFLFTIGDEPTLKNIPQKAIQNIMGTGQFQDYTAVELLEKARKMYNVYHLHLKQGHNGTRADVMGGWKQLIGDNLIIVNDYSEISKIIPEIVATKNNETSASAPIEPSTSPAKPEMML